MKRLLFTLTAIVVASAIGRGQSFEGTTRWNMMMIRKDSLWVAQLEQLKKFVADPKGQAELKAFLEKMKEPGFKTQIDANPLRKAQMDFTIKIMAGADPNSFNPNAVVIKFGHGKSLVTFQGGLFLNADVLNFDSSRVTYNINHLTKTYELARDRNKGPMPPPKKITKTSEVAKILNYTCTKYVVESDYDNDAGLTITNYRVTTEIKDVDYVSFVQQPIGKERTIGFKEIEGIPLECVEFKKQTVPASTFALPAGYTETRI